VAGGVGGRLSPTQLHVRRTEGDGPPVVLVHGAMDRNTSFARVAEALAPLPVVRYDRRGYGRSRTAGTGDLATHVADLVTILDGQPATVVGHSFGGLVALGAAALAPELVTAVGSYEAPVPWVEWWPYRSALLAEDPQGAAERFLRHHIGDDRWERLPRRWREERRAEGMAMAHENIGLGPPDPPFDPTRLMMPVVIGRGGASGPRAARAAHELSAVVAGAEEHVVADAVHEAPGTDPEGYAGFVRAAVSRALRVGR
jgi:pimeloyl-ACP methyl ester carboxylesterase